MNKIKKTIRLTILMSAIAVNGVSGVAYSEIPKDTSTASKTTSEEDKPLIPYADIIGWRFKFIGEVRYKRQYNYTKQKWLGEWEKV